jgi:hypothetical protein
VYPKNHPDKTMGWMLLDKEKRMEVIDFLEARGVSLDDYSDKRAENYWFKIVPVDKSPVTDKKVAILNMLNHIKKERDYNFRKDDKLDISNMEIEIDDAFSEPSILVHWIEREEMYTGILLPFSIGKNLKISRYQTKEGVTYDDCKEPVYNNLEEQVKQVNLDPKWYFEEMVQPKYVYGNSDKSYEYYMRDKKRITAEIIEAYAKTKHPEIIK